MKRSLMSVVHNADEEWAYHRRFYNTIHDGLHQDDVDTCIAEGEGTNVSRSEASSMGDTTTSIRANNNEYTAKQKCTAKQSTPSNNQVSGLDGLSVLEKDADVHGLYTPKETTETILRQQDNSSDSPFLLRDPPTTFSTDPQLELPTLMPSLPPYNPQWPSYLMQLVNDCPNNGDDQWVAVMIRIMTHPHEIAITGPLGGQTAFHAACLRYPPVHIIAAMIAAAPFCLTIQNKSLETPLHLAMSSLASEEVQELLIRAAPQTVAVPDRCGDTPMHFAARQGATYSLLELMVKSMPDTISMANHRGVTPFWILPRSFLHATSLEEIFATHQTGIVDADDRSSVLGPPPNDQESIDDETSDNNTSVGENSSVASRHYLSDWKLTTLFLRFSYYDSTEASLLQQLQHDGTRVLLPCQLSESFHWMVHAAAKTPSCPRETLHFLLKLFPEATSQIDAYGFTPLHYASFSPVVAEPEWDEDEDGFRETEPSAPVVDGAATEIPNVVLVDFGGDTDFLQNQLLANPATPISHTDEDDSKSSVLEIVLESNPAVAYLPDRHGRLPLAYAILTNKSWRHGLRQLIVANPKALEQVDAPSGQPMFVLAAKMAGGSLDTLNTLYHIIRLLPNALTSCRVRRKP